METALSSRTSKMEFLGWSLSLICFLVVHFFNPYIGYSYAFDELMYAIVLLAFTGLIGTRTLLRYLEANRPEITLADEKGNKAAARGYVYLIKSSDGYWKIGRTVDPENRMETFTVKLPFRVSYEHIIPCDNRFSAERSLHQLFRHVRKDGEWFDLSVTDVAFIKSIKRL